MPKQTLLLVLIFALAACAQPTPAPTATSVPPTATYTPVPTETPSPTATPALWQIAMLEYGMPEEQAQKLEGMDVSFEKITQYVDGVLVKNEETGADAFYFDYQTEFLVAVDRWNQVTNAENLSENPVTGEEILSDEWKAWINYLLSKTEDGIGPDVNLVPEVTERGEMLEYITSKGVSYLINYPGLINKGVTYADITATIEGEEHHYLGVVNGYENNDKKYPLTLIARYNPDLASEIMTTIIDTFETMERSPIMISVALDGYGREGLFLSNVYDKADLAAAMDLLQHGDPSEVSKTGGVYFTLIGESELYGN